MKRPRKYTRDGREVCLYGPFAPGTEVRYYNTERKECRAIVRETGPGFDPPIKPPLKDPVCLESNRIFWMEASELQPLKATGKE